MNLLYPLLCLFISPFSYAFYGPPGRRADLVLGSDATAFRIGRDIYHYGVFTDQVTTFGIDENKELWVKVYYAEDLYFYCSFCFSFVMSNDSVLTFVGSSVYEGLTNTNMTVYYFNPVTKTINNTNNAYKMLPGAPSGRIFHQAVITPDKKSVYIFGGLNSDSTEETSINILQFDIESSTFISHGNFTIIGGTATMLPSGIVVLAFGSSTVNQDYGNTLYDTNSVFLYDTNTNKLYKQNTSGTPPLPRAEATGTLGPDNEYIYYYGGNNFDFFISGSYSPILYNKRLHVMSDLVVLNTRTWEWFSPSVSGPPPGGRYGHFSLLYEDNTLIIGGGQTKSYGFRYDFSVLRNLPLSAEDSKLDNLQWFTNSALDETFNNDPKSELSTGAIVGITIGVAIPMAILFYFLWKRFEGFRGVMWKNRLGEPAWTEILRTITRIILLGVLLAYIVYAVIRAIDSPNLNEERIVEKKKMPIPDIRVCSASIGEYAADYDISCKFADGHDCSKYFYPITNTSLFPKLERFTYTPLCKMFAPPLDIYFESNDETYEFALKSNMEVIFFKRNLTTPLISFYITYYTNEDSPYRTLLGLNGDNSKMSIQDAYDRIEKDDNASSMPNTFTVDDLSIVAEEYSLTETQSLTNSSWNYFGFANIYDTSFAVTQNVGTISKLSNTTSIYYSTFELTVKPGEFSIRVISEQRVSTILGGLASAGGVFSVIIAIQTLLFGFRPNSPWGIVQRWSFGKSRRSLRDQLRDRFNTNNGPVPIATRVCDDYHLLPASSDSTALEMTPLNEGDGEQNVALKFRKMEERMQLMEDLFKTYYIDDEIFQKLNEARKNNANNDNEEEMPINQKRQHKDAKFLS